MPPRTKHQSRSIEQHLAVGREAVWPAIDALAAELEPSARRSVEPPWRLVFEIDASESGLELLQGTLLLRDDGDECHVAFGLVFDPEPSEAGRAEVERLLRDMAQRLAVLPGAAC